MEEECNLGKSGVWKWRHLGNGAVEFTHFYKNNSAAFPSTLLFSHHILWLLLIFENPGSVCALNCHMYIGISCKGLQQESQLHGAAWHPSRSMAITVNKSGDLTVKSCLSFALWLVLVDGHYLNFGCQYLEKANLNSHYWPWKIKSENTYEQ